MRLAALDRGRGEQRRIVEVAAQTGQPQRQFRFLTPGLRGHTDRPPGTPKAAQHVRNAGDRVDALFKGLYPARFEVA
jgi:hypothetical protein